MAARRITGGPLFLKECNHGLKAPAALAATAAVFAITSEPIMRHPATTTALPIETVAVAPGFFEFRLPGEYLETGRPMNAPKQQTAFRRGFEIMKYQVSVADYAGGVADSACKAPQGARSSKNLPVTGVSYRDATGLCGLAVGQDRRDLAPADKRGMGFRRR